MGDGRLSAEMLERIRTRAADPGRRSDAASLAANSVPIDTLLAGVPPIQDPAIQAHVDHAQNMLSRMMGMFGGAGGGPIFAAIGPGVGFGGGMMSLGGPAEVPTLPAPCGEGGSMQSTAHEFEAGSETDDLQHYVLRLYVTGMTPRSLQALHTIKELCEQHLRGRYDLEVIDIYQHPRLATDEQIVAVPTLVKQLPAPLRRLIGNLSDRERVLFGLDLRVEPVR